MTLHRKATFFLILATVVWGLSFPLMRGLAVAQQINLPHASSWFLTALTVGLRFGLAGCFLLLFVVKAGFRPTRSEWIQGLGLAFFGSGGLLLQIDGLFWTTASVSAFLTQAYCAIIPIYTAIRLRRSPRWIEIVAVVLVGVGVLFLSGLRWDDLRLGRGEIETLFGSIFFAGQILWLERPGFKKNRAEVFSIVMFFAIAAFMLLFAGATAQHPGDFIQAFSSGSSVVLCGILAIACTLFTFGIMNHWQPHVTAIEAGLIYCLEPVFAAGFALFLPGWCGKWLKLPLQNELFSNSLLLGGSAILVANLAVIFMPKKENALVEAWVVRDSNPEPGD